MTDEFNPFELELSSESSLGFGSFPKCIAQQILMQQPINFGAERLDRELLNS